jgi:cytochrome P450
VDKTIASSHDKPAFPFPFHPLTPSPEYSERRANCPLGEVRLPSGDEVALVVTYRDAYAALADTRLSRDPNLPGAPRMTEGPSFLNDPDNIVNKEGDDHRRLRRIVAPAFTPRRVDRWKPEIVKVANELLDAMESAGPPADIASDYCFQLPVRIICQLLGIPEEDAPQFRVWSNAFLSSAQMTIEQQIQQITEFTEYAADLIARRRREPGDTLLDDLIAARDGEDRLDERELLNLVTTLIAAGNETTFSSLSRFLVTLLDGERELWQQLLADPGLVPAAVDELLRYTILGNGVSPRLALEDVELPSGTIKAGQGVVVAFNSAQHDEAVYPEPETVRFDRDDAPPTLVFGVGQHFCLGAHLAKAELQIGLEQLLHRLPNLRLDVPIDQLRFSEGEIFRSLISLPVTW